MFDLLGTVKSMLVFSLNGFGLFCSMLKPNFVLPASPVAGDTLML